MKQSQPNPQPTPPSQSANTKFSKITSSNNIHNNNIQKVPNVSAHVQGNTYTTSSMPGTSFTIGDSSLRSYLELKELLINLDPIKGKATYSLSTFLNDNYQVPFNKALLLASELLKEESDLTSEILATILSDQYQGSLASLLALSRNLSKN